MPSRLPSVLAAIVLVAVLGLYMCSFQMRATEVGIRKTFGKADPVPITQPGLYWKWPWPIQEAVKYDTRVRILEDTVEETPTADSKNVTLTTFTGWVVADPYKFHTSYPNPKQGEEALRTKIRAHKKAVVGVHSFAEFVSTREDERKLRQIEDELKEFVKAEAQRDFGVDIRIFGIKKLGLPTEVTDAIFKRMIAVQRTKAMNYEAEGRAAAQDIVAGAESKRQQILAVAQRKVDDIESEGRRRVGEIYKRFEQHPELRIFLDKLQALEDILKTRTTLLLDTNFAPIDLFQEKSRLLPAELKLTLPPAVTTTTQEAPASGP